MDFGYDDAIAVNLNPFELQLYTRTALKYNRQCEKEGPN